MQLRVGEVAGEAAAVVEVGIWGASAEHDVGLVRIDIVEGVMRGKGGERVLPGGEHDVLVVWAESMSRVSFRSMQMGEAGGVTIDLPGDPNNFEVLCVSGTLK